MKLRVIDDVQMNMLPQSTRLLRIVLGIVILAASGVLSAQQSPFPEPGDSPEPEEALRRYSVELILFTYDASVSAGTEVFMPDEPPPVSVDDAVSILNPYPPGPAEDTALESQPDTGLGTAAGDGNGEAIPTFGDTLLMPGADPLAEEELETILDARSIELRVLTPEELTMTAIHEKLLLLDAYRPVLWSGWTQVVRDDNETPFVRLRRLGNLPLEMEGDLKLYLSRFLHLVVDVSLQAPTPPDEAPRRRYGNSRFAGSDYAYRAPPVHYRIHDNRIIKSDEIRYFDHPKFGILAKLTRIEEPQLPALEGADPNDRAITGDNGPPQSAPTQQ